VDVSHVLFFTPQSFQTVKFNFRKFDLLESAEPQSTIDVIGVVKRCGDLVELLSKKTGGALFKRDLTLIDQSGIEVKKKFCSTSLAPAMDDWLTTCVQVTLTMWGDKAKEDDSQWQGNPVLGVKKCKVSDYNGVSLSSLASSQIVLNPPVQETNELLQW
jgi:replication factor A1